MTAVFKTQEKTTERFAHINFYDYVIVTSVHAGISNGISVAAFCCALVFILYFFIDDGRIWILYTGSLLLGMASGFAHYNSSLRSAFESFNTHGRVSNREHIADVARPAGPDTADPAELRERKIVRQGRNSARLSGRFYSFTKAQRNSFVLFNIGDKVSRRKLQPVQAWKGKNITAVWGDVLKELEHVGAVDGQNRLTEDGMQWAMED